MAEPFTEMLATLVNGVQGAVGAAFIDSIGEAVQAYSVHGNEEYIKLMGAYQGIALQASRKVTALLDAGEVDIYYASYENISFIVKALEQQYFVFLALTAGANVGQGIYLIRRTAADFNREI